MFDICLLLSIHNTYLAIVAKDFNTPSRPPPRRRNLPYLVSRDAKSPPLSGLYHKKDNPKTWGDGVLIDFGDGTAGFAKKITLDTTKNTSIVLYTGTPDAPIEGVINWGGYATMIDWLGQTSKPSLVNNYLLGYDLSVRTFITPTGGQQIIMDMVRIKDSSYNDVWLWVLVEYNK